MRPSRQSCTHSGGKFPFLFGGTFIEAGLAADLASLYGGFPFLFGGTFIEARRSRIENQSILKFPFLFGGTFIEAPESLTPTRSTPPISLPFRRDFH